MNGTVIKSLFLFALCFPGIAGAAWDAVVDWAQRTELSTATSGVVDSVPVNAGERVKKGTLLLRLEQRALRSRVEQGRAAFEHQKLLREEANRELERSKELYARTLLAEHDLNVAKIAYAEADAAYQQGRAGYHQALQALNHSQLKAPFDAIVIARKVEPGETVVTQLRAEPQLVIAAADERIARFAADAEAVATLKPGQPVRVELAGKRHDGEVESVDMDSYSKGGGFTVSVRFRTTLPALPGSTASVTLR